MGNKFFITFIAVIAAAVLTYLFFLSRQPKSVYVLVARQDLTPGMMITKDVIGWKRMSSDSVQPGYILKSKTRGEFFGAELRKSVKNRQPILISELKLLPGGFYARFLPAGMVAIAVTLPGNEAFAKLIQQGDRVNVLLTRPITGSKQKVSETVLRNIEVMAIVPNPNQPKKQQQSSGSKRRRTVMVLMMKPQQVKKLILASGMGNISYILRSARSGKEYRLSTMKNDYLTSDKVSTFDGVHELNVIQGSRESTTYLSN